MLLLGQRELRDVDDIVHHPHAIRHQCPQLVEIEPGLRRKRRVDQPRQVDRSQQTSAVGRQGLLAARIGRLDRLAIPEIVAAIDAVDKDHAGLGIGIGRAHDLVPQLARRQDLGDGAGKRQFPGRVFFDRLHKGVGRQHREIEHAQPAGFALGVDKGFDVGMVAAQGRHHRAAAIAGAHDRAAHRVPHIHKRQRPGGVGADPFDRRA